MTEKEKQLDPSSGGGKKINTTANEKARQELDDIFASVANDADKDMENPEKFLERARQSSGQ